MLRCDHLSWFQLAGKEEMALTYCDRYATVIREMTNPASQYPSQVLFIGRKRKEQALRRIFPNNNTKRGRRDGLVNQRLDTSTSNSTYPILFADTDLRQVTQDESPGYCHDTYSLPLDWTLGSHEELLDALLARLVFPFTDLICIFAEDFHDLEEVTARLIAWAKYGSPSSLPKATRPRVVILSAATNSSVTMDVLKMEDLCHNLTGECPVHLTECFSAISFLYGTNTDIFSTTYHRQLRDTILRELDIAREVRTAARCLFSATHLEALFRCSLRRGNEVDKNFREHLLDFLTLVRRAGHAHETLPSFLASSLLMDCLPPGMHFFSPGDVFEELYSSHCEWALESFFKTSEMTQLFRLKLRSRFQDGYSLVEAGTVSSAELRRQSLRDYKPLLVELRTNTTCLCCLRRKPEHTFRCGHTICDVCAVIFGLPLMGVPYLFRLAECLLCRDNAPLKIKIKPPQAGVRVLSVDGGGVRGVIPLEHLSRLQQAIGPRCRLQDLVDIAVGTSSGGLIVLALFLNDWDIGRCSTMFEDLSRRFFHRRRVFGIKPFSYLREFFYRWLSDGKYNAAALEETLKEIFGDARKMFDSTHLSGTKVAVTATTISNATPFIFSNYNGTGERVRQSGYRHLRPQEFQNEITICEAFIKPKSVRGLGTFQDGGLGANNPTKLILRESKRIWGAGVSPDIVISLGTGSAASPKTPCAPNFRDVVKDGFIPRLYRSFLSSLDGQKDWRDLWNSLDDGRRSDYFRLNISLPGQEPELDDTECMQELRELVRVQSEDKREVRDVAWALLASAFYFELAAAPQFRAGLWMCHGFIRCRAVDNTAVLEALESMFPCGLEFMIDDCVSVGQLCRTDLCSTCQAYRKEVVFRVRHLQDPISFYLRYNNAMRRKISGFPHPMEWFVAQQGLSDSFGRADHSAFPHNICRSCSHDGGYLVGGGKKRELRALRVPPSKRPRLRLET
ncbi:MAG: hypothetical protein M1833_004271 [Piccolia ochrophora]|nr:MAG: hypothetical protein M1833_004271 [Piccolia ochrophora]